MVLRDAVIDEDIRGWFMNYNRGHLEGYGKTFTAGTNGDLPWLDSDEKIATFCKESNCDLFTIKTIQIKKYAKWRDGKKPSS